MPIDPNIAMSVKPVQIANPLEQYMQVQQIQQAQNQSRLADLMYGEKQRDVDQTSRLNDLYKNAVGDDGTLDRTKLYSGVAAAGLGARLPALQKSFADADKAQADTAKTKSETGKIDHDTATHQFELAGQLASAWAQNPNVTQQQIRSGLAAALNSKIISPEIYRAKLAELDSEPQDSKSLNQWALGTLQQVQKAKDSMSYIAPDANTVATNATSRANNATTVGASMANAAALREQAQATRDAASIQTKFGNEQGLRKEFEGLPEVKSYKQAYPSYAAIKDASSRSTPQSDINIVYGLAKLYDPNSVVREGEYATVANSPSIPEKVKGYAQYLAGGGKLSEGTKRQILAEAEGRMQSYANEVKKARASYEGIATKNGMNPSAVFSDMGDITAGGADKAPPAPVRKYNPATGRIE